mgnify:CR=1 FL=1
MSKYILQLLPLAFLFLLLNCQSTRNSTSLEQNKEVIKDSAISINKQKETETTTIIWYFPTDSFKLKENPFLWIPLANDSGTSKNSGTNEVAKKMMNKMPNFGFLKIEKSNDKLSESVEEQNKSKISENKKKQKEKIIEYRNNWFLSVIMALLGFFFCLVVSRAKIIQKIFGKFKIKC